MLTPARFQTTKSEEVSKEESKPSEAGGSQAAVEPAVESASAVEPAVATPSKDQEVIDLVGQINESCQPTPLPELTTVENPFTSLTKSGKPKVVNLETGARPKGSLIQKESEHGILERVSLVLQQVVPSITFVPQVPPVTQEQSALKPSLKDSSKVDEQQVSVLKEVTRQSQVTETEQKEGDQKVTEKTSNSSEPEKKKKKKKKKSRSRKDKEPGGSKRGAEAPGDPSGDPSSSGSSSESGSGKSDSSSEDSETDDSNAMAKTRDDWELAFNNYKGQVTTACNKVSVFCMDATVSKEMREVRMTTWKSRLLARWEKLEAIGDAWLNLAKDPDDVETIQNEIDVYEDKYTAAMAVAAKFEKDNDLEQRRAVASTTTVVKDRSLFSFGQRKIKKFDGNNPDLYPAFIEEFDALLASYKDAGITDIERFSLLRENVIGNAGERIAGLALSAQNYKDARALLDDIYGDKTQRVVRLHQRIQDCKPASGQSEGFNYNEMERVTSLFDATIRALKQLGFDIEANGGFFLANFRRVYPKQFLAMWDLETDDKRDQTKLLGTSATIMDFISYARARTRTLYGTRDHKKKDKKKEKPEAKTFTVNSTQKSQPKKRSDAQRVHAAGGKKCHLCGTPGHESKKCPAWNNRSVKELRRLCYDKGLCYGCGLPRSMECKCSPCSACGKGIHHRKLCYENNQRLESK